MKKAATTYIFALALTAVAVSSCRKDAPVQAGDAISFCAETSAAENAATRATKTVASNLTADSFGVYAVYSGTNGGSSYTQVFDNSSPLEVKYQTITNDDGTTSKNWAYADRTGTDKRYLWKRDQYYRFRAYHPYTASVETGGSSADGILINYRIVEDQYDLLVAFSTRCPMYDSEGTNRVPMQFHHALSALRFRVAFGDSVDEGTTDVLTEFHITGVMAAGMLKYTHTVDDYLKEALSWSSDAFDSTHEFYRSTTSRTFGVYNPDKPDVSVEPVDIYGSSDADNVVFAIPQTCSDPQYGNTVIHFKTTGGGDVDNTAVLPSIKWEAGKIYTYTLLIKRSSVQVVVSIKDWNEVESTVDINI